MEDRSKDAAGKSVPAQLQPTVFGDEHQGLVGIVQPHVQSFDELFVDTLPSIVTGLPPVEVVDTKGVHMRAKIVQVELGRPDVGEATGRTGIVDASGNVTGSAVRMNMRDTGDTRLFPSHCREAALTYRSRLRVLVRCHVHGEAAPIEVWANAGRIPIMLRSKLCYLAGMTPKQLISMGEEQHEMGGYFIISGNERVLRLVVQPRRNTALVYESSAYARSGPLYTRFVVKMRSVRPDNTGIKQSIHLMTDGCCTLRVRLKRDYLIPCTVLLHAFIETTDQHIFNAICAGGASTTDSVTSDLARHMLAVSSQGTPGIDRPASWSRYDTLAFIGRHFRSENGLDVPDRWCDAHVGAHFLHTCVFPHLNDSMEAERSDLLTDPSDEFSADDPATWRPPVVPGDTAKFNWLILCFHKLYSVMRGDTRPDNEDEPMNQEVLVPGRSYTIALREKLTQWLLGLTRVIDNERRRRKDECVFTANADYIARLVTGLDTDPVDRISTFLATGNLLGRTELDMPQTTGFTIVADKLNYVRYVSHFRSIHRGAFFTDMKTTAVRKLLPSAWGFLCPVHTPDGSPCGLLNHLARDCFITVTLDPSASARLHHTCVSLGMQPVSSGPVAPPLHLPITIDGRVAGYIHTLKAAALVRSLRALKLDETDDSVSRYTEIVSVPSSSGERGLFAGLFLYTSPGRMMRPVHSLAANTIEFIGSMEQVFMDIAVFAHEIRSAATDAFKTTHVELAPDKFLSAVAQQTPFSDFNQSPRNMYQCQMGKQTMGTPGHATHLRSDNKLYVLRTPQRPLVRNEEAHSSMLMDEYPNGTNAVVAVISYTGYDMEDAMILNKQSVERGFGDAFILKSMVVDLADQSAPGDRKCFGALHQDARVVKEYLDPDGMPKVGSYISRGKPLYGVIDKFTNKGWVHMYTGDPAYVDTVRLLPSTNPSTASYGATRAIIRLRICRRPTIGDKFASRHGQKGVCSRFLPAEDMPFSETGIIPDIVFNPHGFPSRMTIGMLIESMAGKSAASYARCFDSTPFKFRDDNRAVDHFGEQLKSAGYNYYGTERFYSGYHGTELQADIFTGIVYYQRLRHMVLDKAQVRSTGPVDRLTHQPVKGRKRRGGIRFGEMERDSLLSHGASFMMQDRLFHCSDESFTFVCKKCGSMLSPVIKKPDISKRWAVTCGICKTDAHVKQLAVPFVFRYLTAELLAMNIRLSLTVK